MYREVDPISYSILTLQKEVARGRMQAATPFSSIDESFCNS